MKRMLIAAAAAGLAFASAASARVAPITPEQRVRLDRLQALENAVRARFSDATFNRVRDMYASVVVAEERQGSPASPRVLVKDEQGWHELGRDGKRRLSRAVGEELDRLLLDGDLWREDPYVAGRPCGAPVRVFILRHALRDIYGRQPCDRRGLAGRAAEVAATLRVPRTPAATTAPPDTVPPPPGLPAAEYRAGQHIQGRIQEMASSFERRSLAGFVDAFAEEVIVELPGRTLRGREAVIRWARELQEWDRPGLSHRLVLQRSVYPRIENGVLPVRWEFRWGEETGQPMRRTYSANWVRKRGLWQIAHMKVSEDKPVTSERLIW